MKFFGIVCLFLLFSCTESQHKEQYRPCSFNPLCTCTNGGPDLGSVCCHKIPFMTIPSQINNFAIYIISFKCNELRFLEDHSLNGTGLWKLQINNNLLTDLPSNALAGLDKTLSILDLSENELVRIPKEAIQNLEKLQNLNLAGNHINSFQNDDFRGISRTLKTLDLSKNALIHIQNDALRNMASLEVLNLAFNHIASVDDFVFQSGLNNLRHMNFMGNQLQQIPLNALASLQSLKSVNLNENIISSIYEGREIKHRINLDELYLEYNVIEELTSESFQHFNDINRLFLKGNPLKIINDTFLTTRVTELYISHCAISVITKNAFSRAVPTLKILDLSHNKLKDFPVLPLTKLIKLSLAGNEISKSEPEDILYYANTLKYLDIRGSKMNAFSEDLMKSLPNLKEFLFNKQQASISAHFLQNAGPSMEKLHIERSSVKNIENGAFEQFSGLKHIDLSYNSISRIENTTFKDLAHSLEKLLLHNALKMSVFPYEALKHLSKLQYLDISGNNLECLPHNSLSLFRNLRYLNLNHNELQNLDINFVNEIKNPNLMQLRFAFNKINSLKSNTFRDLKKLSYLQLNDNLITVIEKSAFKDLDSLITIDLEGNLIHQINNEAFQNLPKIQFINLAYNKLVTFNLEAFDQVGRLSTLKIDASHNDIQNLTESYISRHTSSNIRSINFSHNNISYLENNYFDPVKLSVNVLDLSSNLIPNLTNNAFSDMSHLQTLILSHNEIDIIEEHELRGMWNLQILDITKNNIEMVPDTLFQHQNKLRILSMSYNKIESLPNDIFSPTVLEQLDLSYNNIDEFPEEAILKINSTLQYLDLTGNSIKFLNFSNISNLQKLRHFSISQNDLHLPTAEEKIYLPLLISLDFSHNNIQDFPQWILSQLPRSLESLNLANTSLQSIPVLDTCNILHLNLSANAIQTTELDALGQFKKIRVLDLSNNLLPTIYNNVWPNLKYLRSLHLKTNPIQNIFNNSFSHMEQLQELFIQNLKLQNMQKDTFHELKSLRKIEMDTYPRKTASPLLDKNYGLKEIHLHVKENQLNEVLNGNIPKSVKKIILEGENLRILDESTFINIKSQALTLDIRNTNITSLSQKLFRNMREVKNFTASFTNNKLQTVERIFTDIRKEIPNMFLEHLELSGNQLHCNCEFVWIWEWLKEYEYHNGCNETPCGVELLKSLRQAKCVNIHNKSIINAFKTELHCYSSAASTIFGISLSFTSYLAFLCFYVKHYSDSYFRKL